MFPRRLGKKAGTQGERLRDFREVLEKNTPFRKKSRGFLHFREKVSLVCRTFLREILKIEFFELFLEK